MEILGLLSSGLLEALQPINLLLIILGVTLGLFIGMMPGLGSVNGCGDPVADYISGTTSFSHYFSCCHLLWCHVRGCNQLNHSWHTRSIHGSGDDL